MKCSATCLRDGSSPIIDHTFPLKEIRTAHEYMEKSQMFGKIVLNP